MSFKDHFSRQAKDYARFRPHYPDDLFAYLTGLAPNRDAAWDCATGNGQAAQGLAKYFTTVHATDASAEQIASAEQNPKINYHVASAENSGLASASVALVTVAQALHWFDTRAFYAEAARVLQPGGVLAVWCYGSLRIAPEFDALIGDFYERRIGSYWPPERRYVEAGYQDLPFPDGEIATPPIAMQAQWTLMNLLGYFNTWSAVVACRNAEGSDPVTELGERLTPLWGNPFATRTISWPLSLRVARV